MLFLDSLFVSLRKDRVCPRSVLAACPPAPPRGNRNEKKKTSLRISPEAVGIALMEIQREEVRCTFSASIVHLETSYISGDDCFAAQIFSRHSPQGRRRIQATGRCPPIFILRSPLALRSFSEGGQGEGGSPVTEFSSFLSFQFAVV